MNVPSDARQAEHACVGENLPFFVNGTLSELESARVLRHLTICRECRAELDEQRQLMHLMRTGPQPTGDEERAWQQLEGVIEARSQPRRNYSLLFRWGSAGLAAAATLVLLLAPTVLVDRDRHAGTYRTLTSATPASADATLRAVFIPQAKLADIEALLGSAGCQIVSGPSTVGVYTLGPTGTRKLDPADALAILRASPLVVMAEVTAPVPAGR